MVKGKDKKVKHDIFERLREYCPKEYVTRKELQLLTGGAIKSSTLKQLDYKGRGIANRQIIGIATVYDITDVITWLEENTELINFDAEEDNG